MQTDHHGRDGSPTTQRRRAQSGASERAYHVLRERVLAGQMPLGVRLREDELAAELAVSRTPVRESLLRLYGEGLVERHRDGGFTPHVPNLLTIRQLYEVRIPLEMAALDRPVTTGEPHDPVLVRDVHQRWLRMLEDPPAPGAAFVLEDERFHVDVAAASGNVQLARMLQTLFLQIRTIRLRDEHSAERVQLAVEAHLEMVEALADGHLDVAKTAFVDHLTRSLELVHSRVASALVQMALEIH